MKDLYVVEILYILKHGNEMIGISWEKDDSNFKNPIYYGCVEDYPSFEDIFNETGRRKVTSIAIDTDLPGRVVAPFLHLRIE